jgi:hypothetical protein
VLTVPWIARRPCFIMDVEGSRWYDAGAGVVRPLCDRNLLCVLYAAVVSHTGLDLFARRCVRNTYLVFGGLLFVW